jgi:uncharacterized membrane protein
MTRFINWVIIFIAFLLIGVGIFASIERILDLGLALNNPELFAPESYHIHYAQNALLMYVHVYGGIIFLVTGCYQLIPFFRKKYIEIHRLVGKLFLIISLLVSITALILGVYFPFGNLLESYTTFIFGMFLLYAVFKAYATIRRKNVLDHSYWVRRIFFVSLSIATIRGVMIANMAITGENIQEVMGRSFLIAFLVHATLVEWWIWADKKSKIERTEVQLY